MDGDGGEGEGSKGGNKREKKEVPPERERCRSRAPGCVRSEAAFVAKKYKERAVGCLSLAITTMTMTPSRGQRLCV